MQAGSRGPTAREQHNKSLPRLISGCHCADLQCAGVRVRGKTRQSACVWQCKDTFLLVLAATAVSSPGSCSAPHPQQRGRGCRLLPPPLAHLSASAWPGSLVWCTAALLQARRSRCPASMLCKQSNCVCLAAGQRVSLKCMIEERAAHLERCETSRPRLSRCSKRRRQCPCPGSHPPGPVASGSLFWRVQPQQQGAGEAWRTAPRSTREGAVAAAESKCAYLCQRYQRGYDNRKGCRLQKRRELISQRLSSARGQYEEHVVLALHSLPQSASVYAV